MSFIHKNLASGKWQKLSLVEQMANIGSEVNRVIYWKKQKDKKNQNQASGRVLELIDLTIADRRWKCRLSEIIRLREIFCDLFFSNNNYNTSFEFLQEYFLFFALLAKKNNI